MTYKEYMDLLKSLIIEILKEGKNPWQLSESRVRNGFTNRPYSGANALFLTINSAKNFNGDMRWYTFDQAKKLGCSVKKGEKATLAYYFQDTKIVSVVDEDGNIKKDENGKAITQTLLIHPIFKVYHVFNARQLSPVPEINAEKQLEYSYDEKLADSFIYSSPAMISFNQEQRAFYDHTNDVIHVPPKEAYPHNIEDFYSTTFHEIAHSTGHSSRLNRFKDKSNFKFGSPEYAREELVAEITALSLCEKCDMKYTKADSALYIAGWLEAIKDPSFSLSSLYSDVSKASRFIQHVEDRQRLIEQKQEHKQEISTQLKIEINGETYLDRLNGNGITYEIPMEDGRSSFARAFYPYPNEPDVIVYHIDPDGNIQASYGNVDASLYESLIFEGYDPNSELENGITESRFIESVEKIVPKEAIEKIRYPYVLFPDENKTMEFKDANEMFINLNDEKAMGWRNSSSSKIDMTTDYFAYAKTPSGETISYKGTFTVNPLERTELLSSIEDSIRRTNYKDEKKKEHDLRFLEALKATESRVLTERQTYLPHTEKELPYPYVEFSSSIDTINGLKLSFDEANAYLSELNDMYMNPDIEEKLGTVGFKIHMKIGNEQPFAYEGTFNIGHDYGDIIDHIEHGTKDFIDLKSAAINYGKDEKKRDAFILDTIVPHLKENAPGRKEKSKDIDIIFIDTRFDKGIQMEEEEVSRLIDNLSVNLNDKPEKDYLEESTQIPSSIADNNTSPIVRFTNSEYPSIPSKDRTLSILEAENLIENINQNFSAEDKNVYKTSFTITFSLEGKIQTYSGNYYIGRDTLSFIDRISSNANYFLNNEEVQRKYAEEHGEYKLQKNIENKKAISAKVVIYLKLHKELATQEKTARTLLNNYNKAYPSAADSEFKNYALASLEFVKESRKKINSGNLLVNVFNAPNLADFQYTMPEDNEIKRCYISGPISNNPDYEESFRKAEAQIRACGYEPVNPVEIVKDKLDALSPAETWRRAMELDLEALRSCDALIMLDRRDLESMGMDIEIHMANVNNMPIVSLEHLIKYSREKENKAFDKAKEIARSEISKRAEKLSFFDKPIKTRLQAILENEELLDKVVVTAGKEIILDPSSSHSTYIEAATNSVLGYDMPKPLNKPLESVYTNMKSQKLPLDKLEKEPLIYITSDPIAETGLKSGEFMPLSEAEEKFKEAALKTKSLDKIPRIYFNFTAMTEKGVQTVYKSSIGLNIERKTFSEIVKNNIKDHQEEDVKIISDREKAYWKKLSDWILPVIKNQIKKERDKSLSMSI